MCAAMLLSMLAGQSNFGVLLKGGVTLIVWPAGTLFFVYVFKFFNVNVSENEAIAAAPILSAVAGRIMYSTSTNRDRARDVTTVTLSLISVYTIMYISSLNDPKALLVACITTALCAYTVKDMIELPPFQKSVMSIVIGMPIISGIVTLISL